MCDTEADQLCSIFCDQMEAAGFDPNRPADVVFLADFGVHVRPLAVVERVALYRWREANPGVPWSAARIAAASLCHEDGSRREIDAEVLAHHVAPAVLEALAAECIRVCGLDVPVTG